MTGTSDLSSRELRVLEAVIQMYIETAEPAGSQAVARRSGLGVSPATVRHTMSELERRGYLLHPHTSAGRIPTDLGYRTYVDGLLRFPLPSEHEQQALAAELPGPGTEMKNILHRAAQVLSVLTMELGVALAPTLDQAILERLELVRVSSERLLLIFNLKSGLVRTIFVQIPATVAPEAVAQVTRVLNERLAGLSMQEVRGSLAERLRDAASPPGGRELLNIFLAEGEEIVAQTMTSSEVHLGSARMLADQPEFASKARMRELLEITERREVLREILTSRRQSGVSITIGGENLDPALSDLTLVTASYSRGDLRGVIGVLGPTRMPYEKIIGLVEHTSRLVEGLLD
ncbi:MAG: heat-inducible transcriptional repressor HrcA [Gemmatimonadales bacterium]